MTAPGALAQQGAAPLVPDGPGPDAGGRAKDDPQLAYLDGRELYGEADAAELPLPDALHPDATTHRRIGERFAALASGAGGPFDVGREAG